jgi:hypothetical protein
MQSRNLIGANHYLTQKTPQMMRDHSKMIDSSDNYDDSNRAVFGPVINIVNDLDIREDSK